MRQRIRATVLTAVVSVAFAGSVTGIVWHLLSDGPTSAATDAEFTGLDKGELPERFYSVGDRASLAKPTSDSERTELAKALIKAGSPLNYPHWRSVAPQDNTWNQRRASADLFRMVSRCDIQVHFSVSEPDAWLQVYSWVTDVHKAYQGSDFSLCYTRNVRQPEAECSIEQSRVRCAAPTDRYPDRLHVMVGADGIANTLNGQVNIGLHSNADVLIHELGHALGFADEYPMRYELAMQFCSGQFRFEPLNLKITQSDLINQQQYEELKARLPWSDFIEQPIATETQLGGTTYWRLGSSDRNKTGLFPAATCDGTPYQAWKPVAEQTFMEQHETGSIPELYLKLLQQLFSR